MPASSREAKGVAGRLELFPEYPVDISRGYDKRLGMTFQGFLAFLVIGALAGWISGLVTKGRGFGLAGNMIVGVLGAFLGAFCFGLLGISANNVLGRLLFAIAGALLVVYLLRFIKK